MDENQKKCSNCGEPLADNSTYCAKCGTSVPMATTTPVAPAPVAPPASFSETPQTSAVAPQSAPAVPPSPTQASSIAPAYTTPQPVTPQTPYTNAGTATPVAPGYSAPAQPVASGYNAPTQPAGYSAPAKQPGVGQPYTYGAPQPQNAYQQPSQSPYGNGATPPPPPGAYPVYGGMAPTPNMPAKKKSPALFIVLGVTAIAVIVAIAFGVRAANINKEYNTLYTLITTSYYPEDVADYKDRLDSFAAKHPDKVPADLTELVDACDDYVNEEDSVDKFDNMLATLRDLKKSTDINISDCADNILIEVEDDLASYIETLEPENTTPPVVSGGGTDEEEDSSPLVLDSEKAVLEVIDGQEAFSFNATNTSDKKIVLFEAWIFCYDSEGNPILDQYDLNYEWLVVDDVPLAPGESFSSDDHMYGFIDYSGVALGYVYINYVEFEDGTTWGVTIDEAGNESPEFNFIMTIVKTWADIWAKVQIETTAAILPAKQELFLAA